MKKLFNHPIAIGLSAFVVVLLLGTFLNYSGFHFQGINVVRGGDIEIVFPGEDSPPNVSIFLDKKKITSDEGTNGKMYFENIPPGIHSVLIYNEEKWPWKKDIEVTSGDTTIVSPFLINKNANGAIVTNKNSEFVSLVRSINISRLPSVENKLTSENNLVSLWVENSLLYASWNGNEDEIPGYFCDDAGECKKQVIVLESADPIRDAAFYKNRDDVVIVAFSNGVFALEIDKRGGTQNFQPIYKGTALPRFKKIEEEIINVVDGSAIYIINL